MITSEDIISIGKFRKTHALKGELNASLEIDPHYFEEGNPLIVNIDGIYIPFYVKLIREKGKTTDLVLIDGIDSEEKASVFVNKEIFMLKKDAEEWLDEEELMEEELDNLVGYKIMDSLSGESIGIIEDIDTTTVNTLFIVKSSLDSLIFIPASEDFINSIDDDERIIKMTLPEGLLEIN